MDIKSIEKIVSLSKRRGFIFQSSEIYGGLASTWDYGPLGVEMKNNIKNLWWKDIVTSRRNVVGMDAAILMHPDVWEASGHVGSFNDPFVKCPACSKFFRMDKVWDEIWNSPWFKSLTETMIGNKDTLYLLNWAKTKGKKLAPNLALVKEPEVTISWISELHQKFGGVDLDFKNFVGRIACSRDGVAKTPCPSCGNPLPDQYMAANLMLETFLGPVQETAQKIYLRPETAQGIFVNFNNVVTTARQKLPFGIAQLGKAFRNEITTGNFLFRTREFEQMELEYFIYPEDAKEQLEYWSQERLNWYKKLGVRANKLRLRPHDKDELAHYSTACYDIEYEFPFGWSELEGIADRGTYDLDQHNKFSKKKQTYFDQANNKHIVPAVIEASAGVDRTFLTCLVDAYCEEEVNGEQRIVLKLSPKVAPIKIGRASCRERV